MTTSTPTAQERDAFYAAALAGLRALDASEPVARRFGPEADSRWSQFAGALGLGDRLDILLRDAAGKWGAAFSPADCFGFFGLADDEPFGPDWASFDDHAARRPFTETAAPATLEHVAHLLGVKAASVSVPPITSSTKLVVAGGAAILAVAKVFAENKGIKWHDQVAVVAETPTSRQLAGLAAVLVGATGRTALVRPREADKLRALGFAHLDASVVSPDAEPESAETARKLGGK